MTATAHTRHAQAARSADKPGRMCDRTTRDTAHACRVHISAPSSVAAASATPSPSLRRSAALSPARTSLIDPRWSLYAYPESIPALD